MCAWWAGTWVGCGATGSTDGRVRHTTATAPTTGLSARAFSAQRMTSELGRWRAEGRGSCGLRRGIEPLGAPYLATADRVSTSRRRSQSPVRNGECPQFDRRTVRCLGTAPGPLDARPAHPRRRRRSPRPVAVLRAPRGRQLVSLSGVLWEGLQWTCNLCGVYRYVPLRLAICGFHERQSEPFP